MGSEWRETTIGAEVLLQRGFDITRKEQRPGSVPVVSSGGPSSLHDIAAAKGPGVVLGRKGVVGSVYFVKDDYWPHDTTLWVRDFKGNDPRFVYYFFLSIASVLAQLDVGSANPTLNRNHVHPMKVWWPELDEQRRIARILGTLDDKIELNRRTNETLEAMARALFKSWFVDFDPVRAKAAGRQPEGMDADTAALFPDSFEESELGETPRGWRAGTLGDLCQLNPEAWSRHTRPALIKYVDLSNTKWGRIEAVAHYIPEEAPSRAQRVLRVGDTIVGTVRPGNGSYALISAEGLTGSTGFAVLRPLGRTCTEFVYLAATSKDNIDALSLLADGGAYPAVPPGDILATPVARPPDLLLGRFSSIASGFLRMVALSNAQSLVLSCLRDGLLANLLSGPDLSGVGGGPCQ